VPVRPVELTDAERIVEIYGYYVENSSITFEEEVPSTGVIQSRIQEITRRYPWLVHASDHRVDGFAYASRYKERESYRYTAELSLYVDQAGTGRGIGTQLFSDLISACRETDAAVLIAGVALPNAQSVRLLDRFGFIQVALFHKVGYKFGKWIDVGYWELEIKDRSSYFPVSGNDKEYGLPAEGL
jgi:L-amino acid N-acyltransferase YncA